MDTSNDYNLDFLVTLEGRMSDILYLSDQDVSDVVWDGLKVFVIVRSQIL